MSTIGHNSGEGAQLTQDLVRSTAKRVMKLIEDREAVNADIRDVYAEAKGHGLDVKTLRKLVARQRMDADKRAEQDELLDLYEGVFG